MLACPTGVGTDCLECLNGLRPCGGEFVPRLLLLLLKRGHVLVGLLLPTVAGLRDGLREFCQLLLFLLFDRFLLRVSFGIKRFDLRRVAGGQFAHRGLQSLFDVGERLLMGRLVAFELLLKLVLPFFPEALILAFSFLLLPGGERQPVFVEELRG